MRTILLISVCFFSFSSTIFGDAVTSSAFFDQPQDTVIDFESLDLGVATDQLVTQGVTFDNYAFGDSNLDPFLAVDGGKRNLDNFTSQLPNTNPNFMFFDPTVEAVGFYILTNSNTETVLEAYRDGEFIESQTFSNNDFPEITFVGIANESGFDELRVSLNGTFATHVIDNLHFRAVPEPTASTLFVLVASLFTRRKQRSRYS